MIATENENRNDLLVTDPASAGETLWFEIIRDGARVCTVDGKPDAEFIFSSITKRETSWNKLTMVQTVDLGWTIIKVIIKERSR